MRLAYVCADRGVSICGFSGSSVHLREFGTAMARRGVDVTAFVAGPVDRAEGLGFTTVGLATDPALREIRARMGRARRLEGGALVRATETYDLLLNQSLAEALSAAGAGVDLVYERYSLWSFAGLQFARRRRLPFFLEVNAPLAAQQLEYRALHNVEAADAIEGYLLRGADRVLVTSGALRDYVHARGATRRKIRILSCGVCQTFFQRRARGPRRADSPFVVGFLGSLKPWHGIEVLLEAFARLREISPRYRLLIVGDGPMRAQVDSFVASRGLGASVELTGSVAHEEVPRHLARMDVGVAPYPPLSSFYFSPLKVWEYAAAGVPIIASDSGELSRLFPHRTAALLHPPGKVGKIVKHIEKLRASPDLGPRLARRARAVARRHTWDRLAARFESLARTVVGADRR